MRYFRLSRILNYAVSFFFILLLVGGVRGTYRGFVLIPRLQQDYGFTETDYYLSTEGRDSLPKQFVRIKTLMPGGQFYAAGFQAGDIIVSESPPSFFDRLADTEIGQSVTFKVGTGDRPLDVADLEIRCVTVKRKARNIGLSD